MHRHTVGLVVVAMTLALPAFGQSDEQTNSATVSMTADHWTAAQVAEELENQMGVQVAVTEWTEGSVTGALEDFTLEQAVTSLGEAVNASWTRFYILETARSDEPYTASELILKLDEARDAWFASLTDEQRAELFGMRGRRGEDGERRGPPGEQQADDGDVANAGDEQAEADNDENDERDERDRPADRGRRGFGMTLEGPGGAIAQPPAPEGAAEGDRDRFRRMREYADPIRGLLLPGRTDTITLDLTDSPLQDALSAFMLSTHFVVIADEGLTGAVSVQLEDAPLSDALDAIAAASGAQWRTVYLVSAPRKLTEEEIAQREATRQERREQRFNERWAEFWRQPKEERQESIQRRVQWMERIAERIRNNDGEGQDDERTQRRRGRMGRRMSRMMDRMMNYSTQLTPEQRLEIKPLLQAMAKLNNMQ